MGLDDRAGSFQPRLLGTERGQHHLDRRCPVAHERSRDPAGEQHLHGALRFHARRPAHIFATSYGQTSWLDSQIDTIGIDGTGLTQLSHDGGTDGLFTNYHEFAYYMPAANRIMYGSTVGAPQAGMDFWTMAPDGSSPKRLTYFNFPWSSQSVGFTAVGGVAFDPNNPNHFIASLAADPNAQTINAESVTLNPSPAPGLTEQFFSGQGFTHPIASATTRANPSGGFSVPGSPAVDVPSSQYSNVGAARSRLRAPGRIRSAASRSQRSDLHQSAADRQRFLLAR
jgi:hypothetical protein